MKDKENLKIYKDIGKKLGVQRKYKTLQYRRKVNPENTEARQNQKIQRKPRIKKIQKT